MYRIVWICTLVLGVALGMKLAKADTTYYYNQYGQPQGSASSSGGSTYYYNQYGQPQGSASNSGGTTYYYNQYGQPQGSASTYGGVPQYNYNTQPQWNPYIPPARR